MDDTRLEVAKFGDANSGNYFTVFEAAGFVISRNWHFSVFHGS